MYPIDCGTACKSSLVETPPGGKHFEIFMFLHSILILLDKKVHLEYSRDHGLTWQHVQEKCLPGEIGCHSYQEASIFDDTQYGEWTRITLTLPASLRLVLIVAYQLSLSYDVFHETPA